MAIPRPFPRAASFAAFLHLFKKFDELWLRKRVWGPMQALLSVFALVEPGRASSYQLACKTAHAWANKRFGWSAEPNPSGFNRARNRVTEDESMALLNAATALAQGHLRRVKRLVCGLLPVGVDGSILHMPRSKELLREFGVPTNCLGVEQCHYPQAMLVTAWDLVRRIPLAWALTSHTVGERETLLGMLGQLAKNALLILDRGYPSDVVLGEILGSGRHFVVRMVASDGAAWQEVRDFLAGGKRDDIVSVEVGTGPTRRIVRLRMILRTLNRGRPNKFRARQHQTRVRSHHRHHRRTHRRIDQTTRRSSRIIPPSKFIHPRHVPMATENATRAIVCPRALAPVRKINHARMIGYRNAIAPLGALEQYPHPHKVGDSFEHVIRSSNSASGSLVEEARTPGSLFDKVVA